MMSALGTKADMCVAKGHVCFTPESRHWCCTNQCPLRANSGYCLRFWVSTQLFDDFVSDREHNRRNGQS
jgi:hypothetical protein